MTSNEQQRDTINFTHTLSFIIKYIFSPSPDFSLYNLLRKKKRKEKKRKEKKRKEKKRKEKKRKAKKDP